MTKQNITILTDTYFAELSKSEDEALEPNETKD